MTRRAIQIVDLGYGDSGKGAMVDYLTRIHQAEIVVRFNGGPQAGHNVVLPDGRHHTFSQFGSGSFIVSVKTLLSRFMLIEPYAMANEAAHLASIGVSDVLSRTMIDGRCLVITPAHQVANRIRERSRGEKAHGTCGMGVGECVADSIDHPELSIFAGDLREREKCARKLADITQHKRAQMQPLRAFATVDELRVLNDLSWAETALDVYSEIAGKAEIISAERAVRTIRDSSSIIFEGAQGVLLDERYGVQPHTTWSKTTFTNAGDLLDETGSDFERQRIGVLRTYLTRHGAGPFKSFEGATQEKLPEPHNADTSWQGKFRRGPLDFELLRYSIKSCAGVDGLAITHLDRLAILTGVAKEEAFIAKIENELGAPVIHQSHGRTYCEKR